MLGHSVLEGFAAINKNHGNFVGELTPELVIGIHVHFTPGESTAPVQFADRLFDNAVYNPAMPSSNLKPLHGKTALITGGAKRLGRASALALAEAGADVAITFRNSAQDAQATVIDLTSFGVRAVALRCDITEEKSVKSAIKEVKRELGGLDILINNAANYETANFEDITVKQWDAIFASNTRGPFLVSREALPLLRKRKGRSSIWDHSAVCVPGLRTRIIVPPRPPFTC